MSIFSADWFAKKLGAQVLVFIRHPLAFCSSLKIKNWTFSFGEFLNQPNLMESHLFAYENEIAEFSRTQRPLIEQAALLWNCFHHVIRNYETEHPYWVYRRHEILSLAPIKEFEGLYEILNLKFTKNCREQIRKATGCHNPVEQVSKNEFFRNSSQSIVNWKNRLDRDEVSTILRNTEELADHFYPEPFWTD